VSEERPGDYNCAAHKRVEIRDWLANHRAGPRALHADQRVVDEHGRGLVRHQRTPGHRPLQLGSFTNVDAQIRASIDGWNNRADPSVWTKTADQILAKARRPQLSIQATG